jgi:hypothetical protein
MTTCDPLLTRIRGEYQEMPGLRLTLTQASRLWHLDSATCEEALEELRLEGFLHRTLEGVYLALRSWHPRAVKATLSQSVSRPPVKQRA